jgi:hypothetical protein
MTEDQPPTPADVISRRHMLARSGLQAGALALAAGPALATTAAAQPPAPDAEGLDPTGKEDCGAQLARAAAHAPITLQPGTYRIASSITLAQHVAFAPGARLLLGPGVVVTFAGSLSSPPLPIFEGPGSIVFPTACAPLEGYPEWWGARINDGNYDNRAAFTACLHACPTMQLHNADYFFHDTWVAAVSYRTIRGHYGDYSDTGRGTRLVLTRQAAHSAPQLIAGTYPIPGNQAQATWFLRIEDIALIRDAGLYPVTPPQQREDYNGVAGIIFGGAVHSGLSRVHVAESQIGIWAHGAVHSTIDDCIVVRSIKGNGPNPDCDTFIGYLFGGPHANYGYIGDNASIYARRCLATGNNALADTVGILLKDYLGDTFLADMETALLATGIRIDGQGRDNQEAQQDVSIHHPILDGCAAAGLDLRALNASASISIVDPYIAPTGTAPGIRLDNCAAALTITSGQILGPVGSTGFRARASSGFDVDGLRIRDCSQPVILQDVSAFRLKPSIINRYVRAGAAVSAAGQVSDGLIAPLVQSLGQPFGAGIALSGPGIERIECHVTTIAANALAHGGVKLSWDGRTISSASFGHSCLATGVLN